MMRMMEIKKMRLTLGVLAVVILAVSCVVFAYTLIPKGDTSKLIFNDVEYSWDELFGGGFSTVQFSAAGKDFTNTFTGVRLWDLANSSGLANPEAHEYTVKGSDGYQSTVSWEVFSTGYLVENGKDIIHDNITVFPGQTQSTWTYSVIEIEVV
jgi:hypothetical protein